MKKAIAMLLSLALTAAMMLTPVYASEGVPDSDGSIGNDKYQMQLKGKVSTSTMLVVVVTTSVDFMYDLDEQTWNQIVGGDAVIINRGQSAVTLDIIEVSVDNVGDAISLVDTTPVAGERQISLAMAPVDVIPTDWDDLEDYALTIDVDAENGISLFGPTGLAGGGTSASLVLYGGISALNAESNNWLPGETFTITTIIKAAVVD